MMRMTRNCENNSIVSCFSKYLAVSPNNQMSGSDLFSSHNRHNTIESQPIRMCHSIMIELQPLNIQTDKNQSYGQYTIYARYGTI